MAKKKANTKPAQKPTAKSGSAGKGLAKAPAKTAAKSLSKKNTPKSTLAKVAAALKQAVRPAKITEKSSPIKKADVAKKTKILGGVESSKKLDDPKKTQGGQAVTESKALAGQLKKNALSKIEPLPTQSAPAEEKIPPWKAKGVNAADAEEMQKLHRQWRQMHEQLKDVKAVPYVLSGNYEAKTPIQHKVMGWGYVLKNRGNRIEVLFEEGVKTLVSNYIPS